MSRESKTTPRDPQTITICTRKPSKWRFVDLETGQIWRWTEKGFVLSTLPAIKRLVK